MRYTGGAEAGDGAGDVFRHVELDSSLFVISLESYTTKEVAVLVREGLIVLP